MTISITLNRYLFRTLPLVILASSMIAVLLTLHDPSAQLIPHLEVSNAIGFSVWALVFLIRVLSSGRVSVAVAMLIGVPTGTILGFELGALFGVRNALLDWVGDPWHQWQPVLLSLLISVAAGSFFLMRGRAAEYRAALETQRRQASEARQSETTARLAMLQAQIEPHFLFNTLANVQSMIERDPTTATAMLDNLNRYLRASLSRTRNLASTCADEIELVEALLALAAIRLGKRLRYHIDVPADLRKARLPPLLLQPLVENALQHGIEPAINGGEVSIECERRGNDLVLRVRDTGVGFSDSAPAGVGLSNIRSRLASLFGDEGSLALLRNESGGTTAELTLPLSLE